MMHGILSLRSCSERKTALVGLTALLGWSLLLPPVSAAEAVAPRPAASSLDAEDAPQRFVPLHPRTEDDENRLEAVSLFAAARVQEREEHWHRALRLYQRAARYDPRSQPARREAVLLALRQGRFSEAACYVGDAGWDAADAREWKDMGKLFEESQHYAEALSLYRRARAAQDDEHSAGYIVTCFDVGRMAFISGDFPESAAALAKVMEALEHPDDYEGLAEWKRQSLGAGPKNRGDAARIYNLFAEAFLSADRYDEAAAALEKAAQYAPDEPAHAFRLARVEHARHHPEEALALLEKFFESKQADQGTAPYELLSKVLADLQRSTELVERLAALQQRDPRNALVTLFLADQYREAQQWEMASPLYREVLALAPARGEDRGLSVAASRGLADCLHRLKQTQPLLMLLGELAGASGSLAQLGDEIKSLADDADLVTALVEKARQLHGADPDSLGYGPRLATALLALEAQRYDAAEEFFDWTLKVKREDAKMIYLFWALGLLSKEQNAEAADVLRRAIDERAATNDDPTLHYYWSRALLAADRNDEALDAARHALSLNRENIQLAYQVALVLFVAKRHDEAAEAARELIDRFDEREPSDAGRQVLHAARMLLSGVAVQQHALAISEEWLEQVLDEFPEDVGAQNDLGYLWADEGKHLHMALAMIEHAVQAEPDNTAYRDSLGWIYHRLGRHAEAVAELEKAVAGAKPDGVMLEHLGDAAQAAGQTDKARDAWQKALAAFEKEPDAEKTEAVKNKLSAK
ncbi:MAG TPA: tetratricopeptide repeat protein [Pirellulales bacterium]|nr:tetratricopeptide repeat protein [Pirellulales bacterium]